MASLGHVAVGMFVGRLHGGPNTGLPPRRPPWRALVLFGALAAAPDLDVVLVALGLSDDGPLGHRGASHSCAMAVLAGILVALFLNRQRWPAWRTFLAATAAVGSHPLLDVLDAGRGLALAWPLSCDRFSGTWPVLAEAPRGLELFCRAGVASCLHEALLFSPLVLLALWPRRARPPRLALMKAAGGDPVAMPAPSTACEESQPPAASAG